LFGLVHRTTGRQAEVIEELRVKRANDAYPKTSNAPPWVIHALKIANEARKVWTVPASGEAVTLH
jgi:hypothetical protein